MWKKCLEISEIVRIYIRLYLFVLTLIHADIYIDHRCHLYCYILLQWCTLGSVSYYMSKTLFAAATENVIGMEVRENESSYR